MFSTDLHLIILKVAYFYITGKHLVKSFNKCQHALKKEKKICARVTYCLRVDSYKMNNSHATISMQCTSLSISLIFFISCLTLLRSLSKSAVRSLFFFDSSMILPAAVSAATPVPKRTTELQKSNGNSTQNTHIYVPWTINHNYMLHMTKKCMVSLMSPANQ